MRRANIILNVIMGSFAGIFIGHGAYVIWDFNAHPGIYAMQSAPWYTSILAYGVVTLVVSLICVVIKAIIKHKIKKADGSTGDR